MVIFHPLPDCQSPTGDEIENKHVLYSQLVIVTVGVLLVTSRQTFYFLSASNL